jgi:hypothetical protein
VISAFVALVVTQAHWIIYEPPAPNGKHVVLLAGDEEYRSEEALPMLAKVLSQRHGFKCTVLFSINEKGEIDPEVRDNQPGLENLKTADLVVMALRFRQWPDEQMKHFDEYVNSGKPIIALRTSTHAFDIKSGPYEKYGWQSKTWPGGFGKQVLGETWVSHWGEHGRQATKGVVELEHSQHPILRGAYSVFGTTDVYEAHPPRDATVLMRGMVLDGMEATSEQARGKKKTALGEERGVNSPMMPVVWMRPNDTLTCTMGAATDFLSEGLKRLIVNACFYLTRMEVPDWADVSLVGEYKPSPFGFGGFKRGVKPADLAIRKDE